MLYFRLKKGNATTEAFQEENAKGVSIQQTIAGISCVYSVACKTATDENEITCCTKFDPSSSGEKLWEDLKENGKLTEKSIEENIKSECVLTYFHNRFYLENVLHRKSFMQPKMLQSLCAVKLPLNQ